jgi:hypothetical protein
MSICRKYVPELLGDFSRGLPIHLVDMLLLFIGYQLELLPEGTGYLWSCCQRVLDTSGVAVRGYWKPLELLSEGTGYLWSYCQRVLTPLELLTKGIVQSVSWCQGQSTQPSQLLPRHNSGTQFHFELQTSFVPRHSSEQLNVLIPSNSVPYLSATVVYKRVFPAACKGNPHCNCSKFSVNLKAAENCEQQPPHGDIF